jgi:hypothetical protein
VKHFMLGPEDRDPWREAVTALEEGITYPLGLDRFSLDHGSDYFAFFDRMGAVVTHGYSDGDDVVAIGTGVFRQGPRSKGGPLEDYWYLCDLKVRRSHRGKRLPWKLFGLSVPRHYVRCGRGYGVTMNPGDGTLNPVVRLVSNFTLAPVSVGTQLLFFSLDARQVREAMDTIRSHRGHTTFRGLSGVKDLILESTGEPMPLLHAQFGPFADHGNAVPQEGFVHMLCSPQGDPLSNALLGHGFSVSATATVLHHRMQDWDWSFILTSDI